MSHEERRERLLTPSEVARRAGVSISTLHFYEARGLLTSTRTEGNQRRYHRDVLRRLAVIGAAQRVGIRLADIKEALDSLPERRTPTRSDWARLSRGWGAELARRRAELERLESALGECIGCGCLSLRSCALYNPDDTLAEQGSGAVRWDGR